MFLRFHQTPLKLFQKAAMSYVFVQAVCYKLANNIGHVIALEYFLCAQVIIGTNVYDSYYLYQQLLSSKAAAITQTLYCYFQEPALFVTDAAH